MITEQKEIHYCEFGCGRIANYYGKWNKKWRCSEFNSQCPIIKEKIKNKHIGRHHSTESIEKMCKAQSGKKLSIEHKEKMRRRKIELYANGYIAPMTGKHHTEETRHKISKKVRKQHIFKDSIEYKECGRCKEIKLLNEFSKCKRKWDGLNCICKNCVKIYQKSHRKETNEKRKNRGKTDIQYITCKRLRGRIMGALKRKNAPKNLHTSEYLGCTIKEAYERLMKTLPKGATEQDFLDGKLHIDHIIPCASFDLTKKEEQLKCFNINNLQLLWAVDNLKKRCKILI